MSGKPAIAFAAFTDPGKLREQNEDCVAVNAECGLAVLADGMGGHQGGEIASDIAVRVVRQVVAEGLETAPQVEADVALRAELLNRAVQLANAAILDEVVRRPDLQGMGTTLVVALAGEDSLTVAHVGDSRAYLVRRGCIIRLTKDHTLLQQQLDAGLIDDDQARASHLRSLLTRAVGTVPAPQVDAADHLMEDGDLYLLCSDGLTDMLTDTQILSMTDGDDLTASGRQLIDAANRAGGRDNISVILLRVVDNDEIPVLSVMVA